MLRKWKAFLKFKTHAADMHATEIKKIKNKVEFNLLN